MRFTDFLVEKITKKEIKEILKDSNIQVGAEFEMILQDENISTLLKGDNFDYYYENYADDFRERWKEEYGEEGGEGYYYHNGMEWQSKEDIDDDIEEKEREIEKWRDRRDELIDKKNEISDKLDNMNFSHDDWEKVNDEDDMVRTDLHDAEYMIETLEIELQELQDAYNYASWEPAIPLSTYIQNEIEWMMQNEDSTALTDFISDLERTVRNVDSVVIDGDSDEEWTIKQDTSLSPGGVEVTSPPMDIDDFMETLEDMFNFIPEYGTTDKSCGFHIGMSIKNSYISDIDRVKLILFFDEGYVWQMFPERINNRYTKSMMNGAKSGNIDSFFSQKNLKYTEIKHIMSKPAVEKYYGINFLTLKYNNEYIEFRYIGGTRYHKKLQEVKNTIARYANAVSIALDPNYKQKEYIHKLIRITNKMEYFLKEMALTFIENTINSLKHSDKFENRRKSMEMAKRKIEQELKKERRIYKLSNKEKSNLMEKFQNFDLNEWLETKGYLR